MAKGKKKPLGIRIEISPKCFKWFLIFTILLILIVKYDEDFVKWILELYARVSK